jgi:hypothetical protein
MNAPRPFQNSLETIFAGRQAKQCIHLVVFELLKRVRQHKVSCMKIRSADQIADHPIGVFMLHSQKQTNGLKLLNQYRIFEKGIQCKMRFAVVVLYADRRSPFSSDRNRG